MGSPWKMPTKEQYQELIDNTNHTCTTINNKNRIKFTSKTDTSKYIFLIAAGLWEYTSHFYASSYGLYWSTAIDVSDIQIAWHIYFNSSGSVYIDNGDCATRSNGQPVRAIQLISFKVFIRKSN